MDQAVEDGIGQGRVADGGMPVRHGQLAGDDGRSSAVAFLEDLQEIVPGLGVERFEAPIIQNEQLDAAEGTGDADVAAVAAR